MKKRLLFMTIILALFSLSISFAIDDASSWAEPELETLKEYSILKEEAFNNPKDKITREDFIYLMVTLYEDLVEESIEVDPNISFKDTNDIYALKAATVDITKGVGDQNFAPNRYLTREQLAVFIVKTLKLANRSLENTWKRKYNDDDQISSWAKEFVYIASENGIISGVGVNKIAPQSKTTREQSLVVFKRAIEQYSSTSYSSILSEKKVREYDGPYSLPIENAIDGIVKIYVMDNNGKMKIGSGFYYDFDKIATNYHLIDDAKNIIIEYDEGKYYRDEVKVLGYDQSLDIAALSIKERKTPLFLEDVEYLRLGEITYTVSSKAGFNDFVKEGLISDIGKEGIQITTSIHPDSTGGPVLNEFGDAIGITSALTNDDQNNSLAINISVFKALDKSLSLTLEEFNALKSNVKPPMEFSQEQVGHYLRVQWENTGADYYLIFESRDGVDWSQSMTEYGENKWLWDEDYSIQYLPSDEDYTVYIKLVAYKNGVYSEPSEAYEVNYETYTGSTLEAPEILNVNHEYNLLSIQWENNGADYYKIYESSNGLNWLDIENNEGENRWHWKQDYSANFNFEGNVLKYLVVTSVKDGKESEFGQLIKIEQTETPLNE